MDTYKWAWHCALYLCFILCLQSCSCDTYPYTGEPIPLYRCERSVPIYQIIPAALLPSGTIVPIQALSPAKNRLPRQRQSSVVQQVVINQNSNQQTIPITVGGGDFDGGFGGGGFGGGQRPFFGRPSFGRGGRFKHPFARTYSDVESTSAGNLIPAPTCSQSYILSCEPRLAPAPCSNGGGGDYASTASY